MRKQKQIWQKEHSTQNSLPTMANTSPSSSVIDLISWFQKNNISISGRAVDIGSGKGRNSIFLAKNGFSIEALEYIQSAIDVTELLAKTNNVNDRVNCTAADIDSTWPFPDNTFDLALDSFASIDIESLSGRIACRDEMLRTLRPNGYALVTVVSADDEWEKEMITKNPGNEKNSVIWPESGKFQKNYDQVELLEFHSNFKLINLKKISKATHKLGRDGIATNFWLLLQKT